MKDIRHFGKGGEQTADARKAKIIKAELPQQGLPEPADQAAGKGSRFVVQLDDVLGVRALNSNRNAGLITFFEMGVVQPPGGPHGATAGVGLVDLKDVHEEKVIGTPRSLAALSVSNGRLIKKERDDQSSGGGRDWPIERIQDRV